MPEWILRFLIRKRISKRIKKHFIFPVEEFHKRNQELMSELVKSPIAHDIETTSQNFHKQPVQFFSSFLGSRLKQSASLWFSATTLDEADQYTLRDYCIKADIQDGQKIMDMGCGWGSLTFYISENYKNCTIIAITNNINQKKYLEQQIKQRGISNIKLVINNINNYDTSEKFDRIVSIEMFEYLRNYKKLFEKINHFLKDQGKIFIQALVYRHYTYLIDSPAYYDILSEYYQGGTMPANSLLYHFNDHFKIASHWVYNGSHYRQTLEWKLKNLKNNKAAIFQLLSHTMDMQSIKKLYDQWFTLLLTLIEMTRYENGNAWFTAQYLMLKNENPMPA